jgi:thiol:disulfide interchange protein DsbC
MLNKSFSMVAVSLAVGILSMGQAALAAGSAGEGNTVLASLRKTYPNTNFTAVRPAGVAGMYEVQMGGKLAYTDATGRYFLFGNLVDLQNQVNLTADRMAEMTKIDVKTLPLAQAIKTVKGKGSRTLYVFADPECGYCKSLEKTLTGVEDVTIYTFLMPILGPRSQASAESIWCAKSPSMALQGYMVDGAELKPAKCDNPLARNVALGESMGVQGTPTIFTAAGKRIAGAPQLDRLNEALLQSTSEQTAKGL